ncbi:MAG: rhomboid family intramembrane serine protease [Vicingaceae bacterium]
MEAQEKKKFLAALMFPALFVALLWLIKAIELQFDLDFSAWGIYPRTITGLLGVIFAPLIHGDLNHLFNNSIPLLVLGWALFYFYKSVAFRLILWSYLLSGLYTWISARTNYHIGASGLVYALFGFLFISGFLRKYIPLISISFLVAFLYGSLVWGILPWDEGMSWEGHFWGLFIGLVLAVYYRKKGPQRKKYSWEIEEELEEQIQQEQEGGEKKLDSTEYIYHFVPKKEEE